MFVVSSSALQPGSQTPPLPNLIPGPNNALLALVKPFVDICLLKRNPQDLPTSGLLLGITLAAYGLSGVLVSATMLPTGTALLAGLADTALLSFLTASLLYLQRLQARVPQTLTALAGTGAILGVVALPLTNWAQSARQSGTDAMLPELIILLLLGWSLTVAAHILRHALSTSFPVGLILAIVFFWVSINIMYWLFPVA